MNYHLGLDLGGTKFSGLILNSKGDELVFHEVPVRSTWSPRQIRTMLESFARDLTERAGIKRTAVSTIGIGVPGVLDENGDMKKIINLPALERADLRGLLPRARTSVWNDAVCAAYAESLSGNLAASTRGVHLMLGTGLGSAVMTRLYVPGMFGKRNVTEIENAEAGHLAANIEAAYSERREPYELESYCSRKFFRRHTAMPMADLYREYRDGDPGSRQLFERYGTNVGILLADMDTLFRPDTIVVGGGMTAWLPAFREPMMKTFRKRRFLPGKPPTIKRSAFGPEVGALGAALYGILG